MADAKQHPIARHQPIYPVLKTAFSIRQKRVVRGNNPGVSDDLHPRMLICEWLNLRLVRFRAPRWLVICSQFGRPRSRFTDGL